MKQLYKCINFLKKNGYKEIKVESEFRSGYQTFVHEQHVIEIDISEDKIIFVNNIGDWVHIPCNYFALIGACIHYSQIGIGYKH